MPHLSQFVGRPFGNDHVVDVAIGAGGFVAVGSIQPDLATVWWSPDGRLWQATSVPDLDPEATVLDAVAYDESHGFVVAGRGGAHGSAGTVGELDIWHSADGRSWTAAHVADAQLPDAPAERMQMAASTTGLVIAVPACSASACRLRAWRSADGQSWTPSELAASDPPPAFIQIGVVTASDAGYAVVGTSCRRTRALDVVDATDCAPFTQTSTDGETWHAAYGPRSGRCCWSSVYHAVMAPDGRVLMDGEVGRTICDGDDCELRAIERPIWMFDGQQWAQLRPVLDGIGDVASLGALARSDDSWLALADGALWASADGTRWTLVDNPTGAMPVEAYIAFAGTRGIVVGRGVLDQQAVWLFDLSAR